MNKSDSERTVRDRVSVQATSVLIVTVMSFTVLQGVTWPLWWGGAAFPAVPSFSALAHVPIVVQRIIWIVMLILSGGLTLWLLKGLRNDNLSDHRGFGRRFQIVSELGVFLLTAMLVLMNQHRLQPWCLLSLQLIAISALVSGEDRVHFMRWALIAVYLFSGLSRVGPLATAGPMREIIQTLLNLAGLNMAANDPRKVSLFCHAAASFEILAAVLLWIPRTRRPGTIAACLIHASLILALGPLGLGHHAGVLVWNGTLMILVPLLFWSGSRSAGPKPGNRRSLVVFVILFGIPSAALFGAIDHWIGWQVYSGRTTPPRVFVTLPNGEDRIDSEIEPFLSPPAPLTSERRFRIDEWSLQSTGAPIYPEVRFYRAIMERSQPRFPAGTQMELRQSDAP